MKIKKSSTINHATGFLRSTLRKLALFTTVSLTVVATNAQAEAPGKGATEADTWPCVQRKVMNLSPTTMWDGPAIDGVNDYYKDEAVRKLIPILVSRRVEMSDAEKAIEDFAKAHPEDKRDRALTVLFAGVFDTINSRRRSVIRGIERYQARQKSRASKLEIASTKLSTFRRDAGTSDEANKKAKLAQNKYDWDARVFEERQQNIPFACEIPVNIAQRAYGIAHAIRAQMIN